MPTSNHESPYRGDRKITGEHVKTLKNIIRMLQGYSVTPTRHESRDVTDILKIAECLESGQWEIVRK